MDLDQDRFAIMERAFVMRIIANTTIGIKSSVNGLSATVTVAKNIRIVLITYKNQRCSAHRRNVSVVWASSSLIRTQENVLKFRLRAQQKNSDRRSDFSYFPLLPFPVESFKYFVLKT